MTSRLTLSVAGLLAGLALVQWVDAEDAPRDQRRPATLAERLERFRRNLLGQHEPAGAGHVPRSSSSGKPASVPVQRPNQAQAESLPTGAGARPGAGRSDPGAPVARLQAAPTVAANQRDFEPAQRAQPRTAMRGERFQGEPRVAAQPPQALPPRTLPWDVQRPPVEAGVPTLAQREPTPATPVPASARPQPTLAANPVPPPPTSVIREPARMENIPNPYVRGLDPAPSPAAPVRSGDRLRLPAPTAAPQVEGPPGTDASPEERVAEEPSVAAFTPTTENRTAAVLFNQRMPYVTASAVGPQTIVVGRPAEFRVTVANRSEVAATDVTVRVAIPLWAKLAGSTSTVGTTQISSPTSDTATLVWTLDELAVDQEQHIDLQVVPQRGERLRLAVSCTCAPPVAEAVVEVQEPKLEMVVAGPDDALYGETKHFELTLTNPGTGPAEDVMVRVLRPGAGDRVDDVHKVGVLEPGMSRKIDLEMVARQTGTVFVKAQATAVGGLNAEATKELFVRRPALRIELAGPQEQFAGTMAGYRICITNPGTAAARPVTIAVTLPQDAAYADSTEGGRFDAEEGKVLWQIGDLAPKADRVLELQCVLKSPGKNRLEVFAQAGADLTDSSVITTDVIGVPDLTLELRDPAGPVLIGRDATYEIRIHNRGTQRAERIDVVTFFSEGVEPTGAAGARYEIGPGEVVFDTIDGLAAGQSLVLVVKARAGCPGSLSCRTEVLCESVDIKLAAEETTQFYVGRVAESPATEERQAELPVGR